VVRRESSGRYAIKVAILLLKTEHRPRCALLAVSHEMHHTVTLIRHQITQLIKRSRACTFEFEGCRYSFDDLLEPHPFSLDVERSYFTAQWVGGYRNEMQLIVQRGRVDTLLGWQATHETAFQHEKARGAIGVFPGDGVKVLVGEDKQQALWSLAQGLLSWRFWWKEDLVDGFTIGYRVIEWLG
jgi:hypothetical protein